MKNSIWILSALLSLSAYTGDAQQKTPNPHKNLTMTTTQAKPKQIHLTAQEREKAITFLKETELGVSDAVKDLNEAQLTFKPAAEKWSIEECVKHIAAAETNLWAMVDESLSQTANPEKRARIKFTDADLIKAVEDRSHKSTTFAALEPANSPYKTLVEALTAFKTNREKLIAYVENTGDDLRNHVAVTPIGTYDAYQFILLISAHSNRHTQQIEEVKMAIDYPKH
jgi:hypothetical protein